MTMPPGCQGRRAPARRLSLAMRALTAIVLAAGPAGAARAADLLSEILAAVAREPLDRAPFFELRTSVLFARPAESRGTLTFVPPDRFEKRTEQPIREQLTLAGDTVTISSGEGGTPKVFRLDGQSAAGAYAEGLRAIVAGDPAPLRRHFELETTGTPQAWQLTLRPRDGSLRRTINRIVVKGAGGRVRLVETSEAGGDVSELTLLDRPAAPPR